MKRASLFVIFLMMIQIAAAQEDTKNDSIMITIMLKHHQDKNIDELIEIREKNGFTENFPPAAAKVVSWYVMMGIGQVVTVKIPASELRALNISVERSVWGAFSTEFFPTYDLHPTILENKAKLNAIKNDQQ
ncbi:hypothetical protein [Lunatibacter salilacus]|uniref:hypothetical protein n=1 Tax=Lunatibacter salilacus TaxID=2483804 RepID=UPI001F3C1F85|nr:hypothetical protein [Lunatibacter salilacus]